MDNTQIRVKRDFSQLGLSVEDADAAPVYKTLRSGRRIRTRRKTTPVPEPSGPTLHKFGSLPVEIRLCIWQLAAEAAMEPYHPLRVRLYKGFETIKSDDTYDERRRVSVLRLAAMPDLASVTKARRSLLRVNREAHNEASRLWNHSVPLHKGRKLYFSHSYDIIFIDIREQTIVSDLLRLRRMNDLPSFTADIGHVGFDMVPNYPLWVPGHEDMHPSIGLLFCFPRLHSVSLVHYRSFSPEIKWDLDSDVRWLLKKSKQHGVNFRSFQAVAGFDYNQTCSVGNRQSTRTIRHECAICTIHKCAYMISLLRNRWHTVDPRQRQLEPEQAAFLGKLRRFMLLAATPPVAISIPAYDHHAVGWYNQRFALKGSPLEEEAFAIDNTEQKNEDDAQHDHDHRDESSEDEDQGDTDDMIELDSDEDDLAADAGMVFGALIEDVDMGDLWDM